MTDDYPKTVFEVFEGRSDVVYVFEKEGAYFVEQPYHGIFSIDEAKYSAIYYFSEARVNADGS